MISPGAWLSVMTFMTSAERGRVFAVSQYKSVQVSKISKIIKPLHAFLNDAAMQHWDTWHFARVWNGCCQEMHGFQSNRTWGHVWIVSNNEIAKTNQKGQKGWWVESIVDSNGSISAAVSCILSIVSKNRQSCVSPCLYYICMILYHVYIINWICRVEMSRIASMM